MEILIQCVFIETKKNSGNYKPTYYKKVGNNKAVRISEATFIGLTDTSKVLRPIYKDLL